MYKKILVAVDGYSTSLEAAKRAIEMAAQYGSQVIAIRVEENIPLLKAENMEEATLKGLEHTPATDRPLELVARYGQKHGVNIETRLEKGRITACILRIAENNTVDLIITGDSGRKGMEKLYFGSVAQAVSEGSRCPVLILKKGAVDISDMLSLLPGVQKIDEEDDILPVFEPEIFNQKFKFSFKLFAVFAIIYFGAVLLTSAPMKDIAATVVAGLPLAIWAGWGMILSGVIITRIYLARQG